MDDTIRRDARIGRGRGGRLQLRRAYIDKTHLRLSWVGLLVSKHGPGPNVLGVMSLGYLTEAVARCE